jgi:hypothetical protein
MAWIGRYLSASEQEYLAQRHTALEEQSTQFLADNPFLFATRYTVTEMLIRVELFRKISTVAGAIVECGVAHGNSLMLLGHLSSVVEPYALNRSIIGFDTFAGFVGASEYDPEDLPEAAFADTNKATLEEAIRLFDSNRALGHVPRISIVAGDARETIPSYVSGHPELTIALLYLDFDLYEPTLVALRDLLPLVCAGGIVAFDEFNYRHFAGETKAVLESLRLQNTPLRRLPFAPLLAYFTVSQ